MYTAKLLFYLFGGLNIIIIVAILWKIANLEVSQNLDLDSNSPIRQVKQILANELQQQQAILATPPHLKPEQLLHQTPEKRPMQPKSKPQQISSVTSTKVNKNKIEYGVLTATPPRRVPVIIIRSQLPPEIHERFLKSPMFNSSAENLTKYGLKKTVDYPKSKETHFYYEGYFHALERNKAYFSRNPRHGQNFDKPPAGDFIRAFYEGFRRANNHTFELLRWRLYNSAVSRRPKFPYNDSCGHVAKWLENHLHFSDLSVQIHYGSAIRGGELFWHADAENSLLHFCLTVSGHRTLHSMRAAEESGTPKDLLEQLNPGDMYLSTSALMNHAPEYPAASYSSRIMAIQARFLYLTEDLKAFRKAGVGDGPGWNALVSIIADTLSTATLVSPTASLIDSILQERAKK